MTDLGRGKNPGCRLLNFCRLVHARASVKADGLEAFGFELVGKLPILLGCATFMLVSR